MASTEEVDITKPSAVFNFTNLEKVFEHIRKMCEIVDVRKITLKAQEFVTYEVVCLVPWIDEETFDKGHPILKLTSKG